MWYEHGATRAGELVFVRATIVLDGGAPGYAVRLVQDRADLRLLEELLVQREADPMVLLGDPPDGDLGTDADIEAYFACIGGSCPPYPCYGSADFNGDGDIGTDADIEAFFRVLAGGGC